MPARVPACGSASAVNQLAALVLAVVLIDQCVLPWLAPRGPQPPLERERRSRFWAAVTVTLVLALALSIAATADSALAGPLELDVLRLPLLVLAMAIATWLATSLLRLANPPVVLLDALLLGTAVLATRRPASAAQALGWALLVGGAYMLCTVLFCDLRERLSAASAPFAVRGAPLLLVSAGLFALGLAGLTSILG